MSRARGRRRRGEAGRSYDDIPHSQERSMGRRRSVERTSARRGPPARKRPGSGDLPVPGSGRPRSPRCGGAMKLPARPVREVYRVNPGYASAVPSGDARTCSGSPMGERGVRRAVSTGAWSNPTRLRVALAALLLTGGLWLAVVLARRTLDRTVPGEPARTPAVARAPHAIHPHLTPARDATLEEASPGVPAEVTRGVRRRLDSMAAPASTLPAHPVSAGDAGRPDGSAAPAWTPRASSVGIATGRDEFGFEQ